MKTGWQPCNARLHVLSFILVCAISVANTLCSITGKTISVFVKRAHLAYFKVMLGDQDKPWTPHIVCKPCVGHLRQWTNKSRKSLRFAIPMVWREPKDHCNDCYFCAVKTEGINRKNSNSLTYPDVDSAIRPVPHTEVTNILFQFLKACHNWNLIFPVKRRMFQLTVITP